MKFRIVRAQPFSAGVNMGLDEAIMAGIKAGTSPPTFRLYTWTPSAISIGYFQGLDNEVDMSACKKKRIDIVRRLTGGGAVYHDTLGELTYSILGPVDSFPKDIQKSYQEICSYIIRALGYLGIKSEFRPINDVLVNGKKISGNAQTRRKGVLLQHGTILLDVDVDLMFSILKVGKQKMADKLIKSVKKSVTSVKEHSNATAKDVAEALERAFMNDNETYFGTYSEDELNQAEDLAKKKYTSMDWVGMR